MSMALIYKAIKNTIKGVSQKLLASKGSARQTTLKLPVPIGNACIRVVMGDG